MPRFQPIVKTVTVSHDDMKRLLTMPLEKIDDWSPVNVVVVPREELYPILARTIVDTIKAHNEMGKLTKFIFPVGPSAQYPIAAELSNRENVSWKNVWTFNMDEFLDWEGRPQTQFHSSMDENLFNRLKADLNVPEEQRWFPDPFDPDAIDEKIDELGGIDVAYGGMGEHGHIAFNEPVTTYSYFTHLTPDQFKRSKSRVVELNPETLTRGLNAPSFQFPPRAVTLGMRVILEAEKIVLVGGGRIPIFRIACMHPPSMDFPLTYIQEHPNPKETVTVYVTAHDPYAPYPPRVQEPKRQP